MRRTFVAAALGVVMMSSGWAGHPAVADTVPTNGPAPCSAGDPPYPWRGMCATYNSHNTFYGLYGLGFPTPLGWGICAHQPASGGGYPAPGYRYTLGGAPSGSNLTEANALGWAFSEAQRHSWWEWGNSGQFSANELAVAAKLLYDHLVWAMALPSLDAATQRALTTLQGFVTQASGITGAPHVSLALVGGGTTLHTTGSLSIALSVPGPNRGLANQSVVVHITGATFDQNHQSQLIVTTGATGKFTAPFTTTSTSPSSVTATVDVTLAQPGLVFYDPTAIILTAQAIASPHLPVAMQQTLKLTALGTPMGTIQVHKTGDDPAYLGIADAEFEVLDGSGSVLDTLITDATGATNVSEPLAVGQYTLHEVTAPAGYERAADQTVTVTENVTTIVDVGPAQGNTAIRSTITVLKRDAPSSEPVGGATYSLTYDPGGTFTPDGPSSTCVTNELGECAWSNLLPGNYLLLEEAPPPNYANSHVAEWIYVGPGEHYVVTLADEPIYVELRAHKFNVVNDVAIPGATYDLYAMDPAPPGTAPEPYPDTIDYPGLTFWERAVTDEGGNLAFAVRAGFAWCLREVAVPAGFVIDPDLHCTSILQRATHPSLALPEETSPVHLWIHKYNVDYPSTGVPHAYYALFVRGSFPVGFTPPPTPGGLVVPAGTTLWAIDETATNGQLEFTVPSDHSWCVKEESAPPDYRLDPALHCTGVLTTSTPPGASSIAVPESLAFTGSTFDLFELAGALVLAGIALITVARRRTRPTPRA